ncbi:GNAT family N-acetyltransferase [Neobacillus sp. OS1-32]|jgi:ribosomal protein S18 acetylase RimI-like enzyme|uniref:GNAT family N-acetyltransferase n=1 Tax=Neobacillus paridis TaxID=2803862 RepID=A0ABS1TT37_9BACI|nr:MULTISPECIES: GNAT family N-acetyltransferase [Neobacillus]MBL4953713.1 GNAT family N-acetyltransferase [Neobacillus paridis]WML28665.1 GNAT family N-acetyltransferase [Neobacillus sp. OS1-32]
MLNYRKATINDIDVMVDLRKKQLIDEGIEPNIDIDTDLHSFFINKLNDQSLHQWLVEDQEEVIACGAVIFYQFPPSYSNKSGKKAYITNMYTKKSYRGQGIATSLLSKLVEEAKNAGITKIWLGASKMGRPVYKKFGFKETDEWLELDV